MTDGYKILDRIEDISEISVLSTPDNLCRIVITNPSADQELQRYVQTNEASWDDCIHAFFDCTHAQAEQLGEALLRWARAKPTLVLVEPVACSL